MTDQPFMADATNIAAMSSAQASARLAELQNDATWSAKLLAGNGQQVREFHGLTQRITGVDAEGNPLVTGASVDIFDPDAMAKLPPYAATTESNPMTPREQVRDINGLREQGYNDLQIAEMYDENRTYTAEEHAMAKVYVERMMQDREFQRLLFSGDFGAKGMVNAAAVILTSNIAGAA